MVPVADRQAGSIPRPPYVPSACCLYCSDIKPPWVARHSQAEKAVAPRTAALVRSSTWVWRHAQQKTRMLRVSLAWPSTSRARSLRIGNREAPPFFSVWISCLSGRRSHLRCRQARLPPPDFQFRTGLRCVWRSARPTCAARPFQPSSYKRASFSARLPMRAGRGPAAPRHGKTGPVFCGRKIYAA